MTAFMFTYLSSFFLKGSPLKLPDSTAQMRLVGSRLAAFKGSAMAVLFQGLGFPGAGP